MKKDGDKGKRTLSGKKPATFGGENSKLMKKKESAPAGPRVAPARPMGKDATGSANFTRTSPSRASISVGPATLSMGGKTAKSTGGTNASNARATPSKKSSPMAKMSSGGTTAPSTVQGSQNVLAEQRASAKRSGDIAKITIGGLGIGGVLSSRKVRQTLAKPFKYIADTKNRRARNKAQKEENDAMIVERKAKAEAKNPSTPVGKNNKISKSTMKKLRGR